MLETLRILGFLLAPVAALLFLNLRLTRKFRYPLDFFVESGRKGAAAFLLRSFRTYYDVLLDALIALIIALALSPGDPFASRARAVVIDGSRSMIAGLPGERPLDLAIKRIRKDPALSGADPYLLAFDERKGGSLLVPIGRLLSENEGESAALRLAHEHAFFTVDYRELASIESRGRESIVLLTDRLARRAEGFEVVELGWAGAGAEGGASEFGAYPSSIRRDHDSGAYLASFSEVGVRGSVLIRVWDEKLANFRNLPISRYAIESNPSGRTFRLPGPGLYLAVFLGPHGSVGADFPFRIAPAKLQARAEGDFSRRMLSIFPSLEQGLKPDILLVDWERRDYAASAISGGTPRIVTALVPEMGRFLPDPALAGGRPIAVAVLASADMALGSAALANDNLPLLYDGLVAAATPPPFVTEVPAGTRRLLPAGDSFLADTGDELVPLIPPASEYFAPRASGAIRIEPRPESRLAWAAILAAVFALKLALWRRISGKPLLAVLR